MCVLAGRTYRAPTSRATLVTERAACHGYARFRSSVRGVLQPVGDSWRKLAGTGTGQA